VRKRIFIAGVFSKRITWHKHIRYSGDRLTRNVKTHQKIDSCYSFVRAVIMPDATVRRRTYYRFCFGAPSVLSVVSSDRTWLLPTRDISSAERTYRLSTRYLITDLSVLLMRAYDLYVFAKNRLYSETRVTDISKKCLHIHRRVFSISTIISFVDGKAYNNLCSIVFLFNFSRIPTVL
jgi:hypothetical protein